MNYTQTLRGANCVKWVAICCASLYVFIVIVTGAAGVFTHHVSRSSMDGGIPLPALFGIAGFVAALVASVLGRTLSIENEEHLPVVWTLPVSRAAYALSVVATDLLSVIATFLVILAFALALIATFRLLPVLEVTPDSGLQLLRFMAFPFAMYGLVWALTASAGKGGRGIVGATWVSCIFVGLFAAIDFPQPWSAIFSALDAINPLAYASYSHTSGGDTVNVMAGPVRSYFENLSVTTDICALALICAIGLAAGIWQWRRVEA